MGDNTKETVLHMPKDTQHEIIYNKLQNLTFAKNFFLPFMDDGDDGIIKCLPFRESGNLMEIPSTMDLRPADYIGADQQILGTGQQVSIATNPLKLRELKTNVSVNHSSHYQKYNDLDILADYTGRLAGSMGKGMALKMASGFTTDLYNTLEHAQGSPDVERVIYGNKDDDDVKLADNIYTNLAGLRDNTKGYFNVQRIYRLIAKAQKGLSLNGESLNLNSTSTFIGTSSNERFGLVLLLTSNSYQQLRFDPAFEKYLFAANKEEGSPRTTTGALLKGRIEGVDIYHCPHLDALGVTANGKKFNWDLLLGKSAMFYAMRDIDKSANSIKVSKISSDHFDRIVELCTLADFGCIVPFVPFKNGRVLEMGVIHSFVATQPPRDPDEKKND